MSVPQEVIKQRLVTGIYPNFGVAVKAIACTDGISGFYTGWIPTVTRNVPSVVMTFTFFDLLSSRFKRRDKKYLTDEEALLAGIGAALISGFITHPIDVVKTRLMTQAASHAVPYKGVFDCVVTMGRAEGLTSFYSGIVERSCYMGPLFAIQFSLNNFIKRNMMVGSRSN